MGHNNIRVKDDVIDYVKIFMKKQKIKAEQTEELQDDPAISNLMNDFSLLEVPKQYDPDYLEKDRNVKK